ncbi:class I SAM-dependent methyltransferase [Mycolicibacter sp. MYC123]|uniref:Class I SAM-dependent methyltransferase n=1 Tax=[Mycobacterium] zoologicum TaxID=2872311 RepID=A0ABU5YPR6_9MYCO|nr:class I SAM-dependent methyltransferase [Mycolicibacter sp. MYC123]MEB3052063.1 class I SAM-dependent methyltransferase [Mycolicibacter sp. MYC123]
MASELMDWDSIYRGEGAFEGPPPWNLGEPQPELAALIAAGKVGGEVLDAGCGVAELSLTLAAQGITVVGLDLSPTAVAAATQAAQDRGLSTATFYQADITSFDDYPPGSEGRFTTIVDSTLFHSLPVEGRGGYLRSVHKAAASGASYYMLVFAKGAFPPEGDGMPNPVDEEELRVAVGRYWTIDEVRPAFSHARMPTMADSPEQPLPFDLDEQGRTKLPAFLLTAHKP